MKELLQEAAEVLRRGQADEMINLANRIDAALAEPPEDAMELVDQLDHLINDNQGIRADFDHNKATALIESYGRRVPRAMLKEIWDEAYWCNANDDYKSIDEIAARYGVQVEG